MTRAKWRKLLEPFANEVARFDDRLERKVEKLSDSMLEKLEEAVKHPDRGNCWWATYEAAQRIASVVARERSIRLTRFKMDLRRPIVDGARRR